MVPRESRVRVDDPLNDESLGVGAVSKFSLRSAIQMEINWWNSESNNGTLVFRDPSRIHVDTGVVAIRGGLF